MNANAVIYTIVLLSILSGCAHTPTSQDFMSTCKSLCRGNVTHFQDDTVDCECNQTIAKE